MRCSPIFIRRVVLSNFRSIAACDVALGPLTFLIGPNGAGKSNFIDALRLVSDSLQTSLDHAMRDRGGISAVRRKSTGHPTHFGIRLEFVLDSGAFGHYAFRVGAQRGGAFLVQREECRIVEPSQNGLDTRYVIKNGVVERPPAEVAPRPSADRLYLVSVSGLEQFRPLYDALSNMGFYSLNPDRMRELQTPDVGDLLLRDGTNLSSVLRQMERRDPEALNRVTEYLRQIVPSVESVETINVGPLETIEFRQQVPGAKHSWRFYANNMSDGTLRALGVLVALFQPAGAGGVRAPLVGVEEPEIALHPAAAGVLLDALSEASNRTQIIVTSHSPDLLDNDEIDVTSLLAFISEDGVTKIGQVDTALRTVLLDHLYTTGELLRQNQIEPDRDEVKAIAQRSPRLFGSSPA